MYACHLVIQGKTFSKNLCTSVHLKQHFCEEITKEELQLFSFEMCIYHAFEIKEIYMYEPESMYTESALMFRSTRKNCTMYRDTARTLPEHLQNTAGHQFALGDRTSEGKLRSIKSNIHEVKVKVIVKLRKCAPPATASHRQPPPATASHRQPAPATVSHRQPPPTTASHR